VEVQVDEGPWIAARLERPHSIPAAAEADDGPVTAEMDGDTAKHTRRRSYGWKFWRFEWGTPTPGEHKIRSRAFDVFGNVQPAPDDPFLASRRTYWESNGQVTRRVLIH
jgi:hypothetical protein